MAHKTFGRPKHDEEDIAPEPITFDLGDEEGLGVRSRVNGKMLLRFFGRVESDNSAERVEALLSVFPLVMLRDDGDSPEDWSGKEYDPEKPHKNHSARELRDLAAEGVTPGIDPTSSLGRLQRVLDDPDTEISVEELVELVGWIVGELTGKAEKNSSGSDRSGKSTKSTSTRKRQPRALTPVDSTSD